METSHIAFIAVFAICALLLIGLTCFATFLGARVSRQSLTYVADSHLWFAKMMVGGFVSSIPLLSAIANGYQIQTLRNLLAQNGPTLQSWASNFSSYLLDGIKVTFAKYLIDAPLIILGVVIVTLDLQFEGLYWLTSPSSENDARTLSLIVVLLIHATWVGALGLIHLTRPLMVLRCAQDASFLSLFNIFSHAKFIVSNFRPYLLAQIATLIIASLFAAVAGGIGVVTRFTVLIPLLCWYAYCLGKFWRKLAWSHVLAEAELSRSQGTVLAGGVASGPRRPSLALVLAGLFVSLVLAGLVVWLLVALVGLALSG